MACWFSPDRRSRFVGGETALTLCEYQFELFDARGSDEYLDRFAARLDEFFNAGWQVLDASRDPAAAGVWRVYLSREADPR
ncbi:MAG: hypothetical protein LAN36_11250 [Acidobacteriia bacterium]|nr:hypothetical protein [Terriglobia bacterium]